MKKPQFTQNSASVKRTVDTTENSKPGVFNAIHVLKESAGEFQKTMYSNKYTFRDTNFVSCFHDLLICLSQKHTVYFCQVIPDNGNRQKRQTLFRIIYLKLIELNVKVSIKYSRLVPDRLIETEKPSEKFS